MFDIVLYRNLNSFLTLEDFANDLDLTEEEQIRILEQYELETKQKNNEKKQKKIHPVEEILFEKSPIKVKQFASNDDKQNCINIEEEMKIVNEDNKRSTKQVLRSNESSTSTGTYSSSSTDDDWEKINDTDK